jgi:hypothetical protein
MDLQKAQKNPHKRVNKVGEKVIRVVGIAVTGSALHGLIREASQLLPD